MNIKIGEKIKELRKRHNVTQDKLAEYLGMTPQAVSRWENADCYPDVDLFPAIANFFSITIDELFESDRTQKRQKEIVSEMYLKSAHGYKNEAVALGRGALKEFPNNYDIMYELIHVLDYSANKDEILSLANRILKDSGTEGDIRNGTLQVMALTYFEAGEDEKAKEIVNRFNSIYSCQETMLPCVTRGDAKIHAIMMEIFSSCEVLSGAITNLARQDYEYGYCLPKERQKIMIYEKVIKLFELIYDDGNFGFYNHRIADRYGLIGENYILLNEYDKALECLEKAADYYIAYENCAGDETEFTAILLTKIPNPPGHVHDKPSNMAYEFIHDNLLKKEVYTPVRDHERFKAVVAKLTPYAKAAQYCT